MTINIIRNKYLNNLLLKYQILLLKISGKKLTLLTDIGGEWYLNNMHNSKPSTNKPILRKKHQEEYNKCKGKLKVACDHCKYWKFQIHWKNRNWS